MNKRIKVVSIMLILVLGAVSVAYADESDIPGGGWWSGEMIQNIGTGDATVILSAYGTSGTYTSQTILAPDAAKNFIPTDFSGMPDGFEGAAVVSSDEPIKAIVNVTNRKTTDFGIVGGQAAAQYQGVDGEAVDKTIYFPMAKNDRYGATTTFYVQNAGSEAATAQATFRMDDGNTYNFTTPSIPQYHMVIITPGDAGVPTTQANRANIGSLKVTSTQNLAGVAMEYRTAESPATVLMGTRGFTSSDFDTKFFAPTAKQNRYGHFTGIQVQNTDDVASVNVTLTLTGARGACTGQTYVHTITALGPGESHTFNQIAGQDGEMVDNYAASATIEAAGGNIVAVVSEQLTTDYLNAGHKQVATTYSAFPEKAASKSVSIPMYKENRYEQYTGLMIQNVGGATATNVVVTLIGSAGSAAGNTYTTKPQTIAAGSNIELSRMGENSGLWSGSVAPNNSTYGVKITADQSVFAIANEAVYPGASLVMDNNNYEGFNLP